jgi:mono/diheme cytochrome c family protein
VRIAGFIVLLLLAGLVAFVAWAWESAIDPAAPPAADAFDAAHIEKGARLSLLGNCASCHTAPGGRPFAGGLAMKTPFGTIYSTNITPEPETGIGRWSKEAFTRAMRNGVDRAGRHLYPAFPYDHFRLMTDDDIGAVYAYVMTREPVQAEAPKNDLPFPVNLRMAVAGWKLLFLDEPKPFQPDPARSAEWNRGAYLADGVAHCSSCHTPRNVFGAEKTKQYLAGGEAGDWHAPALNADAPAPAPWTADRLYAYLRFGMDDVHAVPAGPMQPVVRNLAGVPDEDVRALAVYIAGLNGRPDAELARRTEQVVANAKQKTAVAAPAAKQTDNGAQIYAAACASCHDAGRGTPGGALPLSLATSVHLPTPNNLIHIIRRGIHPPVGERGPWMPEFAGALTDQQLVSLVDYLRAYFGEKPAWRDVAGNVKELAEP